MNYKEFYREQIRIATGSLPAAEDGMYEAEFDARCKIVVPQALKEYYLVAGRHEINHGVFALSSPEQLKIEDGFLFFMEEHTGLMKLGIKESEIQLNNPMVYPKLCIDGKRKVMQSSGETVSSLIAELLKGVSSQEQKTPTVNVKSRWKKYIQNHLPQFTLNNEMIVPRGFLLYEWEAGIHTPFRFFLSIQTDQYNRNRFTFDLNWQSTPGKNLGTLFSPLSAPDGAIRIGFLRHILSGKNSEEHYEDLWWEYEAQTDANGKRLPWECCVSEAVQAFDKLVIPFFRAMLQYMKTGAKTELLEKLDAFIRH